MGANSREDLVMTSSGNIGIGTTSPGATLDVTKAVNSAWVAQIQNTGTTNAHGLYVNIGASSTGVPFRVDKNGGQLFQVSNDGNVGIGTTSPSYKLHVEGTAYATGAAGALSDRRHKKNIENLSAGISIIEKLRPVKFQWKNPLDSGMTGEQLGFIAQEVEEIMPSIVMTENNDEQTKALKYNEFVPILVKAMQELRAENEELKSRLDALESPQSE